MLVLVQRTFFTTLLTKDLYRTGVTVCGSDILRDVIVSGHVTFYQINKLFVN